MPGIYLHIPFCKQACHYCNFHFSTSRKGMGDMVEAILLELGMQRDYLCGEAIRTVYFGGGTPSLLDRASLDRILDAIWKHFPVVDGPLEITLEANPDDLSIQKINELKQTPINRLSIGIQSFSEGDLRFMNRAHSAAEAVSCIQLAQDAGFENLTIDLIYGSPTTSDAQWAENLQRAFDFDIPHLSCYCLTVEDRTALAHLVRTGKAQPVDEEHAARQFDFLTKSTLAAGYDHYEISNFAKPGWYSRHNSSYWEGEKYLGVGPSAHSYDGLSRQWNIANNAKYLRSVQSGTVPFEREVLTPAQRYNEYVMTTLRTMWGCNLLKVKALGFEAHFSDHVADYLAQGLLERDGHTVRLTPNGKFLADGIAAGLFA